MKLSEQQLASLSSPRAVNEFLEAQKGNITSIIKQNLAAADIFTRENLQFSTEELVKEVQNSIEEFQKSQQEYDEDRVKQQPEVVFLELSSGRVGELTPQSLKTCRGSGIDDD